MDEQQTVKGNAAFDAFLNLFNLITLGWVAIALGRLSFSLIDKYYSVEEIFYGGSQGALKFSIASLIIVTPIFLFIAGFLHKQYKKNVLNPESAVYRWLTYLMLLISALNIIGSLIAVIFQFLEGEYALASILRILTVFLIASGIFGYYAYDLKRKDYSSRSLISKIFMIVVIVVISLSLIAGFFAIDSPQNARLKRLDVERVNDLAQLSNIIIAEYENEKELPANLSEPKYSKYQDPVTGQPYEYRVIDQNNFELCAEFSLPSDEIKPRSPFAENDWYYHDQGRECFTKSITDNKSPEVLR